MYEVIGTEGELSHVKTAARLVVLVSPPKQPDRLPGTADTTNSSNSHDQAILLCEILSYKR